MDFWFGSWKAVLFIFVLELRYFRRYFKELGFFFLLFFSITVDTHLFVNLGEINRVTLILLPIFLNCILKDQKEKVNDWNLLTASDKSLPSIQGS